MTNENKYYRIRLSLVPTEIEDQVIAHAIECGANGVSEALVFSQPDLTYDPSIIETNRHELDAFFNESPSEQFFNGLKEIHPGIQFQQYEEENKDWLAEWKKGFHPFKLVGPFWVVPSWLQVPAECEKPISIDPGMAFGTGTHATTQMMAYFIHKLAQENKTKIADWNLLDVGTGTAILAMLAQMSGIGLVTGIEIDPEARRVAKENVLLNKLSEVEISDLQLDELRGPYDIVVANIIDGVLIKIKKDLYRVVKPGGYLLVTGILQERDNHFFENFVENTNAKVIRRLEKDEWVGYWLQV